MISPPLDEIEVLKHIEEDNDVKQNTVLDFEPHTPNKGKNPHHIDFDVPYHDCEERDLFSSRVDDDLEIRNMLDLDDNYCGVSNTDGSPIDPVKERVKLLKKSMAVGRRIRFLRRSISRHNAIQGHQIIPTHLGLYCGFHLENRTGECELRCLLSEGFQRRNGTPENDSYITAVEILVNKELVRNVDAYGQWRFPTEDRKTVSNFTLSNPTCRKFIDNVIEYLLPVCLDKHTEEEKDQWKHHWVLYQEVISKIRQHKIFTDSEIFEFQQTADSWYNHGINLCGEDFITNYTHVIGAGHAAWQLFTYRSFYKYCNQGSEAYNSWYKSHYLKSTNRGGHNNNKDGFRSHLEPVIRCAQRELGWRTGLGDYYFENIKYCNKCHQPWSQIITDSDNRETDVTLPLNSSREVVDSQNMLELNKYENLNTIMNSHFDNDVDADCGTNHEGSSVENVVFDDLHNGKEVCNNTDYVGYI